jgi:hypothetical protein
LNTRKSKHTYFLCLLLPVDPPPAVLLLIIVIVLILITIIIIRHLVIAISLAENSCQQDIAVALQLRLVGMTPTVFATVDSVAAFQHDRLDKFNKLTSVVLAHQKAVLKGVSSSSSSSPSSSSSSSSVFDPSLRYTITPSSMMIGYQSLPFTCSNLTMDTRALGASHKLMASLHQDMTAPRVDLVETGQLREKKKKNDFYKPLNVGFLSSYLRTHSVGRLIAGVIQAVHDESKITCNVFISSHFLPVQQNVDSKYEDPIVQSLVDSLKGRVHVLPKSNQV